MHFPSLVVALAVSCSLPGAFAGAVQKPGLRLPRDAKVHRDAVEKIFVTSYEAYKKYAWGRDDLRPVSQSFADTRNGWGASIVDAMSTMHIMGLDDYFDEAVEFCKQIDFSRSKTDSSVSVFETTIRHLGGLLSAYELSNKKHPELLQKAKEVADKMAFAWVGDNAVPYGFLDFATDTPRVSSSNIAEAGTLSLEWETLTKHTGNQTYSDLAVGSLAHIAHLPAPLPALAAQGIDPTTGTFVGGYVTWGGGSDSYFEYLIKYARLTNTDDSLYADTWHTAIDSSMKNLLKRSTVGDHLYLADFDSLRRIRHVGSHLACFHGGNWIYGGKLMNNQTIVNIGLELTDACWNTYASTATGIGPEVFAYMSAEGNFTGGGTPSPAQLAFYAEHGYYLTGPAYILRPEVLESNFYAYRATGDRKYLDRAAAAIDSINKYLAVADAFAGIDDVNNVDAPHFDHMESFWFAEVLKYLYLTFDDPRHISLDEWVFNTEAHPFKAPRGRRTYGTGTIFPSSTSDGFTVTESAPLPEISPNPFMPESIKDIINPER